MTTKRISFAPGGTPGLRISRPGYDADLEPLGSQGIAFDTRLDYVGGAWKVGTTFLNTAVPYPFTPTVLPHLFIYCIGSDAWLNHDIRYIWTATGQNTSKPCVVGKMHPTFFEIVPLAQPYYNVDVGAVGSFTYAYVLIKADI